MDKTQEILNLSEEILKNIDCQSKLSYCQASQLILKGQ